MNTEIKAKLLVIMIEQKMVEAIFLLFVQKISLLVKIMLEQLVQISTDGMDIKKTESDLQHIQG